MAEQFTPSREPGKGLCLKYNNVAANGPCAICGQRTDPVIGLEIFVEGTWSDLCGECIEAHAPELAPYRGMGVPVDLVMVGDKEFAPEYIANVRSFMLASGMEGMSLELALKFYRRAESWFYNNSGAPPSNP